MLQFSADETYALFNSPANRKTIDELYASDAETFIFPELEAQPVLSETLDAALLNLETYDWLIFPDVFAVDHVISRMHSIGVELFEIDNLSVCALGESVADRLRFSQLHADVITHRADPFSALAEIQNYLGSPEQLTGLRVLSFHESKTQDRCAHVLSENGADCVSLPVYSLAISEQELVPRFKALLKGGAIDEFIFSSQIDVLSLAHLFPNEHLDELLKDVRITATAQTAKQALEEFRISIK